MGLVDHIYPQLSACTYTLESVSLAGDIAPAMLCMLDHVTSGGPVLCIKETLTCVLAPMRSTLEHMEVSSVNVGYFRDRFEEAIC